MRAITHLGIVLLILLARPVHATPPVTAVAEAGSWRAQDQAFGRVSARAESILRLPFPVRIAAVRVAPGQPIDAGGELLRLRIPELAHEIRAYRDARQAAALAAKRLVVLRRNEREHSVTRRELIAGEQAQAQAAAQASQAWDGLRADLAVLSSPLERATLDRLLDEQGVAGLAERVGVLRAPFAGVVARRPPPAGAWLEARAPLIELEDLGRVYVSVGVPEAALGLWGEGETAIDKGRRAIPLTRLPGAPGIDPQSGLRLLRYGAGNPDGVLRDGEWVRVLHRAPARAVVWVPRAAVVDRSGRSWCIGSEQGRTHPVAVETGAERGARTPVLSGLKPGQRVVTEGAYELLYRDLKDLIEFVD